jgi:hypothetical protein
MAQGTSSSLAAADPAVEAVAVADTSRPVEVTVLSSPTACSQPPLPSSAASGPSGACVHLEMLLVTWADGVVQLLAPMQHDGGYRGTATQNTAPRQPDTALEEMAPDQLVVENPDGSLCALAPEPAPFHTPPVPTAEDLVGQLLAQ